MADRRSVVITGASAGVGRATALKFAREGARLTLIARSPEGLESARREVEGAGGEAIVIALDVADAEAGGSRSHDCGRSLGRHRRLDQQRDGDDVRAAVGDVGRRNSDGSPRWIISVTSTARCRRCGTCGRAMPARSSRSARRSAIARSRCSRPIAAPNSPIRGFTEALRSELLHDSLDIRLVMVQLPAVNTPQFDWAAQCLPATARSRCPRSSRPKPLPTPSTAPRTRRRGTCGLVSRP